MVAKEGGNTAAIINLKSGVLRLTIDAMIGIYGLGVIGNTVVAVGDRKVIAWDLPVEDCASDAWAGPGDGSWTITRNHSSGYTTRGASFSPDSRYIALTDQYSL